MKRNQIMMLGLVSAMLCFQTACYLPEDFDASINVKKDGSYTFNYNGRLVFALALASMKEGKFTKADEKQLKEQEKELRQSPEIKKAKYIGNARFDVVAAKAGGAGEDYYFLSKEVAIFSFKNRDDGVLQIESFKLADKDASQIQALDVNVGGTLSIAVDRGLKVLDHNADKVSAGLYQWRIKNPAEAPKLVVQL